MKNRKLIAKSNLKKSLYLGGGMAAFTAAIGLAVSIPVYNKIQSDLKASTSKLADLSGFMSQLVNKLGMQGDDSFEKELAGGYTMEFSHGKTRIFQSNGEGHKVMIMNMNEDGSVGSAAVKSGSAGASAAKAILALQEAADVMGTEGDAMNDILGPLADSVEDESLHTEAAMTSYTVDELIARNTLATDEKLSPEEKTKRLVAAGAKHGISETDIKLAQAKAEIALQEQRDREDLERQARAGDAVKLAELKAQKDAEAKAAAAKIKALHVQQLTEAKAYLDKQVPKVDYSSLSDEEIVEKVKELKIKETIEETSSKITTTETEHAGTNPNILQRIATMPAQWGNVFAKTYGLWQNGAQVKEKTSILRDKLKSKLLQNGLKEANYDKIRLAFEKIIGVDKNGYAHNSITFKTAFQNFDEKRTDYYGLYILQIDIKLESGKDISKYFLAKSSQNALIDFDQIVMTDAADLTISGGPQTTYINSALDVLNSKEFTTLKESIIVSLLDSVKSNTIKGMTSLDFLKTLNSFDAKGIEQAQTFKAKLIYQESIKANPQEAPKGTHIPVSSIEDAITVLKSLGYVHSTDELLSFIKEDPLAPTKTVVDPADVISTQKAKMLNDYINKETTDKEYDLAELASLKKYLTGHQQLIDDGYLDNIVKKILTGSFSKTHKGSFVTQLDNLWTILEKIAADPKYKPGFKYDFNAFIFSAKKVDPEVIKSINELLEFVDGLEDTDGIDEPELAAFDKQLESHIDDESNPDDIEKIKQYIVYMIGKTDSTKKAGGDYSSTTLKDTTMDKLEMYGDKFFDAGKVNDTLGDDAHASYIKFMKMYEAAEKAGSTAALDRVNLLSHFSTITDAWQSGIVDAKPVPDAKGMTQGNAGDQAIPTTIFSIGYDESDDKFYMLGTLSGAGSISVPTAETQKADRERHKIVNGQIAYDDNKKYSLFLFEAKLVEKDGKLELQYHRVTSMDYAIESDYNKGRKAGSGAMDWSVDQEMSTASVSTYNPKDKSFIAYGSGGSYANGHSKIWFDGTSWQHKYVDWKPGKYIAHDHKAVTPQKEYKEGAQFDGHAIGDYYHIGMSTIINGNLYASETERSNWYEITETGVTNNRVFSSVPSGYFKVNPAAGAAEKRLNIPNPNMVASVINPTDEATGVSTSDQWAVFIDTTTTNKLMRIDINDFSMKQFEFYEMDKDGNLVPSKQEFDGSEAITVTDQGSIYISAGQSASQQVYRIFLSDGKWQIEKVGKVITGLKNPITSLYHYKDSKGDSYIAAISLDGVKVIKDIFAA